MLITGGCLCGKVHYEVSRPLGSADHCHCSMCRRQHGAAFSTYADVEPGAFTWVSGEDFVKVHEGPAGGGWCFCGECGSTLAGTYQGEISSITLGSVEGDPGVRPEGHIFVGSKALWYVIQDDLPRFRERPPKNWTPPNKRPV